MQITKVKIRSICFYYLMLLVLSAAEQVDFTKNHSKELATLLLKDIQDQLVVLNNTLKTLSSQVAALTIKVDNIFTTEQLTSQPLNVIKDCSEVDSNMSGVFPLSFCSTVYNVFCNQSFEGGGWLVVYNRYDGNNTIFNQTWESYKQGFGEPNGEYFIGLQRLHTLTYGSSYEIAYFLTRAGAEYVGIYDHFEIDNERDRFPIRNIGNPRGSLRLFRDHDQVYKFQTYDKNHLHPLARDTMLAEACAFWFVDMPHGHDSLGFLQFCQQLRRLKIMIRKPISKV